MQVQPCQLYSISHADGVFFAIGEAQNIESLVRKLGEGGKISSLAVAGMPSREDLDSFLKYKLSSRIQGFFNVIAQSGFPYTEKGKTETYVTHGRNPEKLQGGQRAVGWYGFFRGSPGQLLKAEGVLFTGLLVGMGFLGEALSSY